jgi:hypothetical protein
MTFPTVDPNMDEMDEIRPKMQYLWASPTLGTIHLGHQNLSKTIHVGLIRRESTSVFYIHRRPVLPTPLRCG